MYDDSCYVHPDDKSLGDQIVAVVFLAMVAVLIGSYFWGVALNNAESECRRIQHSIGACT